MMPTDPLLSKFFVTGIFIRKYYNVATGSPGVADTERYFFPATSVIGTGIPVPLTYTSDAYRMDGSTYVGMNIQSRTVTIQMTVIGDLAAKKAEIYNIFAQDPRMAEHTRYDLCLELSTCKVLTSRNVVLLGVEPEVKSPIGQTLTITIFCPDPAWYGASNYYSSGAPICALCPSTHTLNLYGTWLQYPVITLVGLYGVTVFNNLQTGRSFTLDLALVPGETITITTKPGPTQGIYSDIQGDLIAQVVGGSLDFPLDPTDSSGTNVISIPGSGGSHIDIVTFVMTVSWENTYIGV